MRSTEQRAQRKKLERQYRAEVYVRENENSILERHAKLIHIFGTTPEESMRRHALKRLARGLANGDSNILRDKHFGVLNLLTSFHWGDTPEVSRELAGLYLKAGLIVLNRPTPGQPPDSDWGPDRYGFTGKLPLAIAIEQDHLELAQLLVESGADVDNIGAVLQGGAVRRALEYSHEIGKSRLAAYFAEVFMSRRLAAGRLDVPAHTTHRRRVNL